MQRCVILFVLLALAGCAKTFSYKEPSSGPMARVRFATNTNAVTVLRAYDDPDCKQNEEEWMRLLVNHVADSTPRRLGLPLWNYHENAAKEVYVEAGRERTWLFKGQELGGGYAHICGVAVTFTFAEGKDYEVKFKGEEKSCSVVIAEFRGTQQAPRLQELARFDNRIDDAHQGCEEAFKKFRAN